MKNEVESSRFKDHVKISLVFSQFILPGSSDMVMIIMEIEKMPTIIIFIIYWVRILKYFEGKS